MRRKIFRGKVVSVSMAKTAVVLVDVPKRHRIYGKALKVTKKFAARNDTNAKLGDDVFIEESRPYSKNVTFTILKKSDEKVSK